MSDTKTPDSTQEKRDELPDDIALGSTTHLVNASGHPDQLNRQYGILSICGMALTVDNAWVAIGTSLNVAICKVFPAMNANWRLTVHLTDNGGPPGVLYEFLLASFYYCFIAASIAEVCPEFQ
jgi:hypothetical protein